MPMLTEFLVTETWLAVEIGKAPFYGRPWRKDVLVSLQTHMAMALYCVKKIMQ
jgi:hypothetical protein